jgi:hypothetical protein
MIRDPFAMPFLKVKFVGTKNLLEIKESIQSEKYSSPQNVIEDIVKLFQVNNLILNLG